jgi:hypothetical protein
MCDPIGFIVNGIVTDSDTYFHIIGRCGDHAIQVGDEFDTVYAPAKSTEIDYPGLGQPLAVKLKIERIQAYQRELSTLSGGMTGTIDVRGQGLEHVVPGAVLATPAHGSVEIQSADAGAVEGKMSA